MYKICKDQALRNKSDKTLSSTKDLRVLSLSFRSAWHFHILSLLNIPMLIFNRFLIT